MVFDIKYSTCTVSNAFHLLFFKAVSLNWSSLVMFQLQLFNGFWNFSGSFLSLKLLVQAFLSFHLLFYSKRDTFTANMAKMFKKYTFIELNLLSLFFYELKPTNPDIYDLIKAHPLSV